MRQSASGCAWLTAVTGSGASRRIEEITDIEVSPRNGRVPVAISYRVTPSERMSVRWSTGRPSAGSGDM
jgi:hypothetical protein